MPYFFYSVVFCQFWRHLMIKWVIGRMCIPKCHWKIIVVNLVEQRWFFSWRCLVVSFCVKLLHAGSLVLCVPGQYRVFPPLAAIIAASRRCILATRRWRRCTGICAHLSSRAWRSSSRFWGGLSIELIARPNSSQRCSMGLQSGDLGGCSIFVTLPCCRKSRTTLARWGVALSSW